MFSDEELKLLSTSKGIEYLLSTDKPDFKDVLKELRYEQEMTALQVELIKLQTWVTENEERVLVLVEGRDFAGKGPVIQSFAEHLNPRSLRTVALRKPTEKEKSQWYFKRYISEIPESGELVFFNRSWYNRAIVEPVNGFCTRAEYKRFMDEVNNFERMLVNDGIYLIKFYMAVSKDVQAKRIEEVKRNPLRRWVLSPVDLRAQKLWDEYTKYTERMFKKTSKKRNPWTIIESDDRREANLQAVKHLLKVVPYK